jgi:hypothetical protein
VLLGFQLRGPFEKLFDTLAPHAKAIHGVSLMLMVVVIGLLIAPGVHHRALDQGHASWRMHRGISRVMEATLALFAASIAMSMFVAFEVMGGRQAAWVAALLAAAVSLFFWFGIEILNRKGKSMTPTTLERIPLEQRIDQMLTEARVVLPGAQALLGFQLAVVLTESFAALTPLARGVHGFALACIALSTVLLMAPAAYHRIVYEGEASPDFLTIGSRFLLAATGVLAAGLAADCYVVIGKIAESDAIGLCAAAISFAVLTFMWLLSPLLVRRTRHQRQSLA